MAELMSAELETLAQEAASLDAELTAPSAEEQAEAAAAEQAQAESYEGVAELATTALAEGVEMLYPGLVTYTPDTREKFAAKLAPVLSKHGIGLDWLARWKEEIDFGVFAAALAFKTWQLVKAGQAAPDAPAPTHGAGFAQPVQDRPDPGALHTRA